MDIKEIAGLNNLYEKFLEDYSCNDKLLALYGAGSHCEWVMRFLEKYGITPIYIIDKKARGIKNNVPIVSLQDAMTLYKKEKFNVLIATPMYEEEARNSLLEFVADQQIYSFECELYYSFIHDLDAYRNFLCDNEKELMDFYHELQDEMSKETMENVLKGRISGNLDYFRRCRQPNQYYIDELFDPNVRGTFLDVGASIGDTLEALSDRTNNSFEQVYCFEPSQDAYAILQEKAKKYGNRVVLINKGAWDKEETLEFHEDAEYGGSKIVSGKQESTIKIMVDKLDNMVDEK